MKFIKVPGSFVVAIAAMMAFAAGASATTVSSTTGGPAETPAIHAVNETGHVIISNPIANISCSATFEAKVEAHGGEAVEGSYTSSSFTGCTNSWHVTHDPGKWTIIRTGPYTARTKWDKTKFTTTRFGVSCTYVAEETEAGTDVGGNPATLEINASIPISASESSGLCGTGNATVSGSFVTTAPLWINP